MRISEFVRLAHKASVDGGWWDRPVQNGVVASNDLELYATKIALIHSEISEALEGLRKGIKDDHLPHRDMVEVELADAMIRIGDLAGKMNLDLEGAIREKMLYNAKRADHKPENRRKAGGKAI